MGENPRQEFDDRLKELPALVEKRLQLVWRYFRDVTQGEADLAAFATIKRVQGQDPEKRFTGFITDGYRVEKDDFFAIYDAISEALQAAKTVTELDLTLPRSM
jgi:hypothetical protein